MTCRSAGRAKAPLLAGRATARGGEAPRTGLRTTRHGDRGGAIAACSEAGALPEPRQLIHAICLTWNPPKMSDYVGGTQLRADTSEQF